MQTEECCLIELHVGDIVQRTHPWDGSAQAGTPHGPFRTVKQIHPQEPHAVCMLSDGKCEFEFNLRKYEVSMDWTAHAQRAVRCSTQLSA